MNECQLQFMPYHVNFVLCTSYWMPRRAHRRTMCHTVVWPVAPRPLSPQTPATFRLRTPSYRRPFFPFLFFLSPSLSSVLPPVASVCFLSMPFEARVKSVLSGDTVVLSHVTNPSQERILSLAYVSAPRLRREGDEVGT